MREAVLLLSFGGPEGPDDVLPFLRHVTAGRDIPDERLAEVGRHYERFGGVSPINGQNRALVAAVSERLRADGPDLPVYWGNRHWHPFLADTLRQMADDGIERAFAFVTSAFSSYSGCRQYLDALDDARAAIGAGAPAVEKLRVYFDHPGFVDPMADALRAALASQTVPAARVVFSAHSIPVAMADSSRYVAQLREASGLVADRAGATGGWELVYQSRSGPPQVPWLEPDISDHLRRLATEGARSAVVVPIGFVSDHMEVVYDLDTVARETAAEVGIDMVRIRTSGTDPRFVEMICELVRERLDPTLARRSLGSLGLWPTPCVPGCCPAPRRPAR